MVKTLSGLNNGFFIVLEGIDGAGKTTISMMLMDYYKELGYRVHYTYEPFETPYINLLKERYSDLRDAYLDALTYAIDRYIHLKTDILPRLREGYIVICDRYYYSSVAYQSAQEAPFEWLIELNRFAYKPDVAIYLDVEPEIGLARRRDLKSRFPEYETRSFLVKVREYYLRLVDLKYLEYVDANREPNLVFKDVLNIIREKLKI